MRLILYSYLLVICYGQGDFYRNATLTTDDDYAFVKGTTAQRYFLHPIGTWYDALINAATKEWEIDPLTFTHITYFAMRIYIGSESAQNENWGFHPYVPSFIKFSMYSNIVPSGTNRDMVIAFSSGDSDSNYKWFSSWIPFDTGATYPNKISPQCDTNSANPSTLLYSTNVVTQMDCIDGYDEVSCGPACNNCKADRRRTRVLLDVDNPLQTWDPSNLSPAPAQFISYPLSFEIENRPGAGQSVVKLITPSYTQTCYFNEAFPTEKGLDIYFSVDSAGEDLSFTKFFSEYWYYFTPSPTTAPSIAPSSSPSKPTYYPSPSPTNNPSHVPTYNPTPAPTKNPTTPPTTINPTNDPTIFPTLNPTLNTTLNPTINPTINPTNDPTIFPTLDSLTTNHVKDTTRIIATDPMNTTNSSMDTVIIIIIIVFCGVIFIICTVIIWKRKTAPTNVHKPAIVEPQNMNVPDQHDAIPIDINNDVLQHMNKILDQEVAIVGNNLVDGNQSDSRDMYDNADNPKNKTNGNEEKYEDHHEENQIEGNEKTGEREGEYVEIINILRKCDNVEWKIYLKNFKKHKITDERLEQYWLEFNDKGVWKELIPEFGIRFQFKDLWGRKSRNNEAKTQYI